LRKLGLKKLARSLPSAPASGIKPTLG
jgi:hypothetical protein